MNVGNMGQAAQTAIQGIQISPAIISLIDFSIIAILVFAFVDGLRGGLFSFVLNIIAFVAGYIAAKAFYIPLKKAFLNLGILNMKGTTAPGGIVIDPAHVAGLAAFLLVFSVAYALTKGIAYVVSTGNRTVRYSATNRVLGGVVNLVVTSAILAIAVVLLQIYAAPLYSQIAGKSISIHYLSVFKGLAHYVVAQAGPWFTKFYYGL